MTFSTNIAHLIHKRYSLRDYGVGDISFEESLDALSRLIGNSESVLAANEFAKLTRATIEEMTAALRRISRLIFNFYRIGSKATALEKKKILTIKIRHEPLVIATLVLGALRFTGYLDEFMLFKRCRNPGRLLKIRLPKDTPKEYNLILKTTPGDLTAYPDAVFFLAINCITHPRAVVTTRRGVSAIEVSLYTLGRRAIELRGKETNETNTIERVETEPIQCSQNPEAK